MIHLVHKLDNFRFPGMMQFQAPMASGGLLAGLQSLYRYPARTGRQLCIFTFLHILLNLGLFHFDGLNSKNPVTWHSTQPSPLLFFMHLHLLAQPECVRCE